MRTGGRWAWNVLKPEDETGQAIKRILIELAGHYLSYKEIFNKHYTFTRERNRRVRVSRRQVERKRARRLQEIA